MAERQQVLHLWLAAAALDAEVTAWAFYDGTGGVGDAPALDGQPYRTGVDALADGWFLLQAPGPIGPASTNAELSAEYVFERRVQVD